MAVLELVTDPPQEVLTLGFVPRRLDASGREAVDDSYDASAEFGLRDQHLDWVRCGAKEVAYLRDQLDGVQDVHWEAVPQEDDERVASADSFGVSGGRN